MIACWKRTIWCSSGSVKLCGAENQRLRFMWVSKFWSCSYLLRAFLRFARYHAVYAELFELHSIPLQVISPERFFLPCVATTSLCPLNLQQTFVSFLNFSPSNWLGLQIFSPRSKKITFILLACGSSLRSFSFPLPFCSSMHISFSTKVKSWYMVAMQSVGTCFEHSSLFSISVRSQELLSSWESIPKSKSRKWTTHWGTSARRTLAELDQEPLNRIRLSYFDHLNTEKLVEICERAGPFYRTFVGSRWPPVPTMVYFSATHFPAPEQMRPLDYFIFISIFRLSF